MTTAQGNADVADDRVVRALAAHRAGSLDEAERLYRAVLDGDGKRHDALHLLGVLAYQRGQAAVAQELIGRAIAFDSGIADYHANLGLALQTQGWVREAAARYRRAVALRPSHPEALNNLGTACQDLGRFDEALDAYRRACRLRTTYAEALVNTGTALRALDRHEEAEAALRRALCLGPADPQALGNLGVVLKETGRRDGAEAVYRAALRLAPGDPETLTNLGLLREAQGRRSEAEALYRQALDRNHGHRLAQWNLALLLLGRGALSEGYGLAEARFALGRVSAARALPMPRWRGEPLAGRRILVWREQGLGDELLHGACLPDLVAVAGRVIVECDRRLVGLFARSLPGAEVRAESLGPEGVETVTAADADFQVPMASLPRAFRPTLAHYPRGRGWLVPDPERLSVWQERLRALGPGLRVGICWRSRVMTSERRIAYTTLDRWAPVFAQPGMVFVNLQYDATEMELAGTPLRHWPDADLAGDLETAAALTAGLDLVISVATSVGEMAGALGVPVWRLTGPYDWSMLGTGCRPAFSSMRVWRAGSGEWPAELLPRVAAELGRLAAGSTAHRNGLDRARNLHAAGRGEEAERAYRELLDADPRDIGALHGYGRLGQESGRPDIAAELIGRAAALGDGDNAQAHDPGPAHEAYAAALAAASRDDAAALVWWRLIQLDPSSAGAFAGLAERRAAQQRHAAAARAWDRALAIRPGGTAWIRQRNECRRAAGLAEDSVPPTRLRVDPATAVAEAVRLHENGRLDEADALYAAILETAPRHADALHLRGLVACQTGRFDDAVGLIGLAVEAGGGRNADHQANFAYALHAAGRATDAEAAARRALRLNPALAEAANTLGNALSAQRRWEEAVRAYREALRRRPGYPEAEGNLGVALHALGRETEAEPHLRRALAGNPSLAEAELALGAVLLASGMKAEAMPLLRAAVRRRPAHAPAWAALARVGGAGAIRCWTRAMALEPGDAAGWNAAGLAFQNQDRIADATACFARAVALDPAMAEALTNLGSLRRIEGRPEDAVSLQRAALKHRPGDAGARTNLALALQDIGRPAEAEAEFGRALGNDPAQALARFNRGILRLGHGRMEEGWTDYAARFDSPQLFAPRRIALPTWDGGDLSGRSILVWREQGLGDELMFSSCYPDLIARAGGVILECDRRLVPLFTRSFPGTIVRAPTVDPQDADVHAPAGTLPRHLRGTIAAFPHRTGWLLPDPDRARDFGRRLTALGPGLKVGIAWTSRRVDATRRAAYTRLDDWAPVFALAGIHLVSLQYDGRDTEIAAAERNHGIRIHRFPDLDLMNDLDGAAALTSTLDLVIGVASSVGEMAGALGVPAWRLGGRDWTQLGTGARPWYTAQRVFHPPVGTGTAGAVERAAACLKSLLR